MDTGTSGAVVGIAYRTGHFNRGALITSSYTLTATDEEFLRGKGILPVRPPWTTKRQKRGGKTTWHSTSTTRTPF